MMKLRTSTGKDFARGPQRQEGAALVVGLITLLVITLIAVGSMRNSTMQEKMAANSQNINRTFQGAESAIGLTIRDVLAGKSARLSEALHSATGKGAAVTVNIGDGAAQVVTRSQVEYLGEVSQKTGVSLTADKGDPSALKQYRFGIVGTGEISTVGAKTQITQGIEYH